jgi:hypothetical protein
VKSRAGSAFAAVGVTQAVNSSEPEPVCAFARHPAARMNTPAKIMNFLMLAILADELFWIRHFLIDVS